MTEQLQLETTDSWPISKILKHIIFPKPKGSPKAGKKEIAARVIVGGFFAIILLSMFGGSKVPKCSDDEATNLVIEIAREKITSEVGKNVADALEFSVNSIRTQDINKATGAYRCAAQFVMSGKNGSKSKPITYTVELADNKEEIYVNVFGFQ